MSFLADAMLGRLARWMRFLGYDVLYFRDIEDRELVRIARSEGRIVLTRDRRLPEDFQISHYLVASEKLEEQLTEVLSAFPLAEEVRRRCMKCNRRLQNCRKEEARERVPEYIFRHHTSFQRCPSCGTIYWQGSHTENIMETIANIDGKKRRGQFFRHI